MDERPPEKIIQVILYEDWLATERDRLSQLLGELKAFEETPNQRVG